MTGPLTAPASSADTRQRILDAAESLFVEHGYAATSLRAIASEAGVNLAATNYHFGSKMGLLAAVFHRRIEPINELRLKLLEELEGSERPLTIRSILEAFFAPLKIAVQDNTTPAVIGRFMGEPESITKPIVEQVFAEVASRYQNALLSVLPDVSREDLQWRFHFMIGSMIHLLQFSVPIGTESDASKFSEAINRLIDYSIAGLQQVNGESHD